SRRRHTRSKRDWSSDVCSSDLGGEFIEKGAHLTRLSFDKTGTLTIGKPVLSEALYFSETGGKLDVADTLLARLALSLASRSDHPISKAIVAGSDMTFVDIDDFAAVAGHGTQGFAESERLLLGNRKMMQAYNVDLAPVESELARIEEIGRAPCRESGQVWVAGGGRQ